jgi:hypothetical protein
VVVEPWLMSVVDAIKVIEATRIYTRIDRLYLLVWVLCTLSLCKFCAASAFPTCTRVQSSRSHTSVLPQSVTYLHAFQTCKCDHGRNIYFFAYFHTFPEVETRRILVVCKRLLARNAKRGTCSRRTF